MTTPQHNAKVAYWKKINPKVRSERMRKLALTKNNKMTKEQRRKHAQMMACARWKKLPVF